jgi:glycosyltransferase involved in cell wall biosynthesis
MEMSRRLSFVMAARNDEKYVLRALDSILSQDLTTPIEVIVAIGLSQDSTKELVENYKQKYPSIISIIENPEGDTASGLNLAIAETSGDFVLRVDSHSVIGKSYASAALEISTATNAANVGGRMMAVGESAFQRALAHAYGSRAGLGGGSFHIGGKAGPVDTVYLGCFQKSWLDKVGGFDPKWVRGQDWELNKRIREAGGLVWFDPRLEVTYYPRDNWKALAKQFFNTGIWRGALTREAPTEAALRYWIPPLLVLSTIFWLPLWLYLIAIGFVAVGATELSWRSRLWLMIVLPTMHFSWGIGFWIGLVRGAK